MLLVANNLYRGPRPSTQEDIEELINGGFTDIIDLESGTFEALHDDSFEKWLSTEHNIWNHRITCSYFTPPYKEQVQTFIEVVLNSKGNVFVHCKAGKDRTGFMCAVYRMQVCGWSYEEAVKEYRALGLHFYYFWWVKALKAYRPALSAGPQK